MRKQFVDAKTQAFTNKFSLNNRKFKAIRVDGRCVIRQSSLPFFAARCEQTRPQFPIEYATAVPGLDDFGRGRIETGNARQPGDASVNQEIGRFWMMPRNMRGQAPHRQGAREGPVDEE